MKRSTLEELLKDDVSDEKIDRLMGCLLDTFKPKGLRDDMEIMFDLSKEDIGRVNGIVSALDDFDAKTMIDTIKRRKEAADRTTEINRILKHSMSEEDVNAFAQKENEILKKKDDLTRQLFEAQHMLEDIGRELQIKEQIRDKAMQTLKSNAQNKHVYELSAGISTMNICSVQTFWYARYAGNTHSRVKFIFLPATTGLWPIPVKFLKAVPILPLKLRLIPSLYS